MTTWGCNCTGDPVADCTRELLPAILAADPTKDADWASVNQLLQTSQANLVARVCDSCWSKANVKWVNAYVEIGEVLSARLGGQNAANRLFLTRPAAVESADQRSIDLRHDELWEALGREECDWWLSVQLAKAAPRVVEIRRAKSTLVAHPDVVSLGEDPAKSVYERFFGGLETFTYLHLALPCRKAFTSVVGPAGVYLLLSDSPASIPPCLEAHLQTFLHSIVMAHLWSLGEHVRRRVEKAAAAFPPHLDGLRILAEAAAELVQVTDPIGIDTTPFDLAQKRAHSMFPDSSHDVKDWMTSPIQAVIALRTLADQLGAIPATSDQGESKALVDEVRSAISSALDNDDLLAALRNAKALDRHSVCLDLLKRGGGMRTLLPKQKESPEEQAPVPSGAPVSAHVGTKRFLREAVVRLYTLRDSISVVENGGVWLRVCFGLTAASTHDLVVKARDLVKGRPAGGRLARHLAPVLRGLQGDLGNAELEQWWIGLLENENGDLLIKVSTRTEEAE